jgi:outer membrane cobalamin receptor
VGDRKDRVNVADSLDPAFYTLQTVTLDNYFDLNAHAGYKYSERLTGFLKLNNITGQDYQKWVNYPVQCFQFLIGASYKFNF